jgi:hypothetical protein
VEVVYKAKVVPKHHFCYWPSVDHLNSDTKLLKACSFSAQLELAVGHCYDGIHRILGSISKHHTLVEFPAWSSDVRMDLELTISEKAATRQMQDALVLNQVATADSLTEDCFVTGKET